MIRYKHYDEWETEITINGIFAISRTQLTEFEDEFEKLIEKYQI